MSAWTDPADKEWMPADYYEAVQVGWPMEQPAEQRIDGQAERAFAATMRGELDKANAELERLRAEIRTLSDWHEAKAEKAVRYPGPGRDNHISMSKAADVHRDASCRLRALLDPTDE